MTTSPYPAARFPIAVRGYAPVQVNEEVSQFQRLGFNILLVFVFLTLSRIFDVKFGNLHITGIAFRFVLAMVLLSRAFLPALKTPIGRTLLGLTICMGFSVPFSVWRSGSKELFQNWATFTFIAFLAMAGLVANYQQWLKVNKAVMYALFVFALIANIWGINKNGRLFLEQGKFSNPNEMAQALLLGLPLWGAAMVAATSGPRKVFSAGVMLLMLITTFRTGSRGAMIAFVAMIMAAFLRASVADKLKLVMVGVLFLGVVSVAMPGKLIARYKTVADTEVDDPDADEAMLNSAQSSTESRKVLLRHSLVLTLHHPLLGVGMGMFEVADNAYSMSLGLRKGTWLGTHNSYTQVSSEIGIPGFLCFIIAVFLSLKGPLTIYKQTRGDPRLENMGTIALGMHYTMLIYAVTVLFEHIAYSLMLPIFGGMVAALMRTAPAEIERIKAIPLAPIMSPATFVNYVSQRRRPKQAVL